MSVSVLTLPVPGWYPDPTGTSVYRWWDGETWTEGLHDGLDRDTRSPMRLFADETLRPEPPAEDEFILPAEAFTSAPERVSPPVEPVVIPEPAPAAAAPAPAPAPAAPAPAPAPAAPAPAPAAAPAAPAPSPAPAPPAATLSPRARRAALATRWASLLVAFPFVFPIAVGMVAALAYAGGAASNVPTIVVIAASAAVLLLIPAFILAEQDRRELLLRGVERAPSLGWMLLLPPVAYLIARRRAVPPAA